MTVKNIVTEFHSIMIFLQDMPLAALTDEEVFPEPNGSRSDRKTSVTINKIDVLSVNELLDSVRGAFPSFNFIFCW